MITHWSSTRTSHENHWSVIVWRHHWPFVSINSVIALNNAYIVDLPVYVHFYFCKIILTNSMYHRTKQLSGYYFLKTCIFKSLHIVLELLLQFSQGQIGMSKSLDLFIPNEQTCQNVPWTKTFGLTSLKNNQYHCMHRPALKLADDVFVNKDHS